MAVRCTAFIPSLAAVEAGACEEMEESNKVSYQCVGIEEKKWIMVVQEEARDKSNAAKEISNCTCCVALGKTPRVPSYQVKQKDPLNTACYSKKLNASIVSPSKNQREARNRWGSTCEKGMELSTCEKGMELSTCEEGMELSTCEKGMELSTCEEGMESSTCEEGMELSTCEEGMELSTCEEGMELSTCEKSMECIGACSKICSGVS